MKFFDIPPNAIRAKDAVKRRRDGSFEQFLDSGMKKIAVPGIIIENEDHEEDGIIMDIHDIELYTRLDFTKLTDFANQFLNLSKAHQRRQRYTLKSKVQAINRKIKRRGWG